MLKKESPYVTCPWHHYSQKLSLRIEKPRYAGFFTPEEAIAKQLRLVIAQEEIKPSGMRAAIFLLVDEEDGVVADAKYQVYGHSALIGALEAACEVVIHKNYTQIARMSADFLDKTLRDVDTKEAFPLESAPFLNLALSLLENSALQCQDIPCAAVYTDSPIQMPENNSHSHGYPGWKELSKQAKLTLIEEVINQDIRPYIELDAGGVQILDLIQETQVIIAYQGSCTSCHAATGSTLSAIQHILKTKLCEELVVIPDLSHLKTDNT